MVYSFDIFDTTLLRLWANPTDLFLEVGYYLQKQGLININAVDWMKLRIQSELELRRRSVSGEITINDIYSYIGLHFGWTRNDWIRAEQIEIEVESIYLLSVSQIKNQIDDLKKRGERVIFISDTYMPKLVIKRFLVEGGIDINESDLYISSELEANKASGKLFKLILKEESIEPRELVHTGDNVHSDFKIPSMLGIKGNLFSATNLNRYEKCVYELCNVPLKFRSLLAGISRAARLNYCGDNNNWNKIIWDVAVSVIGPVLFGFVFWCLEKAKDFGIQRLYFIARDGQILLRIAEIIKKSWGIRLECKYLYGSRQAWHLPAIEKVGEEEFDWIFAPTFFLSVNTICNRLDIEVSQISNVLLRHGFEPEKWYVNLSDSEREELIKVFQKSEVKRLILSKAKNYRERTLGYLRKVGLGDRIPFGIVDIGWNGNLQKSLSRLLKSADIYPARGIVGFYFTLMKTFKVFRQDKLLAYFSDPNDPFKCDKESGYKAMMEVFTAADHGSVVKYGTEKEDFAPVLRSKLNVRALNWGLEIQHKGILQFSKLITNTIAYKDIKMDLLRIISREILEKFFFQPTFNEARIYGSFEISEDQFEEVFYPLAPKITLRSCLTLLLKGIPLHHNVWLQGSYRRSLSLARNAYKLCVNFKSRNALP